MATRTPTPPTQYGVEPGTLPKPCTGNEKGGTCTAPVYWITSAATGARIPVDCSGHRAPTDTQWGAGVNHFATCPDRDLFRKRK